MGCFSTRTIPVVVNHLTNVGLVRRIFAVNQHSYSISLMLIQKVLEEQLLVTEQLEVEELLRQSAKLKQKGERQKKKQNQPNGKQRKRRVKLDWPNSTTDKHGEIIVI